MPGFNNSHIPQTQNSRLLALMTQPRFLRAIPSLMVLTTAMAWGASSHAGGLAIDGALRSTSGGSVAAGPALGAGVGVSLGANSGVKAASGAGVNADVRTGANVTAEEPMAAMGSASADAQGAGSAAVRTGQRATQGAKAGATVDTDAGTGVKAVTPVR